MTAGLAGPIEAGAGAAAGSSGAHPAGTLPAAGLRQLAAMLTRRPDRVFGGLEQVLTSIFSMVGFIVLSRLLDVEGFGTIAGAIGIALVVQMVHDSVTVGCLIVDCPDPRQERAAFGEWLVWHFLVVAAATGTLLATGLLIEAVEPIFGRMLVLAALIVPGGALFSFTRRMHYHWTSFRALLLQSGLYGALYAGGLALLWVTGTTTAWNAAVAVAVAFGIPGLIFTIRNVSEARFAWNTLPHVRGARRLIASLGATGLLWQSSYASALIFLSWLSTPAAVAIFTVTRTLERPVALVISTVLDVDTSRASRRLADGGIAGLTEVVTSARWTLLCATLVPIALMLAFPQFFLTLIYGETYAGATLELKIRVLVLIPLVLTAPLIIGLTVMRDTAYLLRVTLLGFAVGFAFLTGAHFAGQLSAATANASLLLMQLTTVPFLGLRYAAKIRAARGTGR